MFRHAVIAAMLLALAAGSQSFAVTAKDKKATCKFGADDQHLTGKARKTFMKNCMADKNDPRGPAAPDAQGRPKN